MYLVYNPTRSFIIFCSDYSVNPSEFTARRQAQHSNSRPLTEFSMSWSHLTYTVILSRMIPIALKYLDVSLFCRDAAAALVGSLGLIPSINAGDNFVMGEPFVILYCHVLCHILTLR